MMNRTWFKDPDHVVYAVEDEVVPRLSRELGISDLDRRIEAFRKEPTRDGENINGGLLVNVTPADFPGTGPLGGIAFQRQLEQAAFRAGGSDYTAPAETVQSFLKGEGTLRLSAVRPTYDRGVRAFDLGSLLPGELAQGLRTGLAAFDRKLPGYAGPSAVLTGLETRTSSPVRLERGADFQCTLLPGLYPCGEGAGYAGGIMSAAVDGIRCAGAIIGEYVPIQK